MFWDVCVLHVANVMYHMPHKVSVLYAFVGKHNSNHRTIGKKFEIILHNTGTLFFYFLALMEKLDRVSILCRGWTDWPLKTFAVKI